MRKVVAGAPFWVIVSLAVLALAAGLAWASELSDSAPEPTATPSPSATATESPTATATATATSTPTSTPLPDRHDCDKMRGTKYRSIGERKWFLAHCVTPTATPGPISEALDSQAGAPPAAQASGKDWRHLVCSYDWDCSWAMSVISCESGGDPSAYNPAGPYVGLFQILDPSVSLFDPAENIAAAYSKYLSQGPSAWGACA